VVTVGVVKAYAAIVGRGFSDIEYKIVGVSVIYVIPGPPYPEPEKATAPVIVAC